MRSLLQSTKNTRALPTGTLRYIRSDVPARLTEEEVNWLMNHQITTLVDLRSDEERLRKPCCLETRNGFSYVHLPVTGGNAVPTSREHLHTLYRQMVDGQMERILDTILNAKTNVMFFCTAGKDRTGVVSALLLKRLEFSDQVIIDDYMESKDNLMGLLTDYAIAHPEADREVLVPHRENMKQLLEWLSGQAEGFFAFAHAGREHGMEKAATPFWEEAYRKEDERAFSVQPNQTLQEFEHLLPKQSSILEAGCGEGQNVLYLAKQGYDHIDAFDLSEAGIAKLKRLCQMNGVKVNAFVRDLRTYCFQKKYDLILSFATLCFVEKHEWKRFIRQAKENTNVGGIHIMHLFTDAVPASADIAPFAVGLAHDGELKELYEDWDILRFQSYVFDDEHPNVPKHLHAVNKIVARKK